MIECHRIYLGDNLGVLRREEDFPSGSVGLMYLDPPFNSGRDYMGSCGTQAEGAKFKDKWGKNDVDDSLLEEISKKSSLLADVIYLTGDAHDIGMMSYLAFMGVRLLEMKRVLSPSGSIYLHCDDRAVHYVKMVMDTVFGRDAYRGNLIWKRHSRNNAGKNFGRVADHILYYAQGRDYVWNPPKCELSRAELRQYRHEDARGRYKGNDLTAPGTTEKRRFVWRGAQPGPNRVWAYTREKLEELYHEGMIHTKGDGVTPSLAGHKKYLSSHEGSAVQNIWDDISRVPNNAKERIGFPTQKPETLLKRIIETSSNKGDVVLDPFCGSGTTLAVADDLDRRWVGIDVSRKACEIAKKENHRQNGVDRLGQVCQIDCVMQREMPRYEPIPEPNVWALKVLLVGCTTNDTFVIRPFDSAFAEIEVPVKDVVEFLPNGTARGWPHEISYFVHYEGGKKCFMSTREFESKYRKEGG